ncbi:WXG100 family type VII secretion target [Kitasatospora kifunensis]|uniref:Uncharacterized protein YukE n=1 Tax=Kitasatospora kifunensis TaxID=58351 RepID=A0A7W7R6I2_KITKI|nr:WXG100 family type VII secretion target [Kitasatospora kifunensis]MBB4926033.1 uncharacterized protein YukE [Kitasatospora kifunensis]
MSVVSQSDAGVQAIMNSLENHLSSMNGSRQTVETKKDDIAAHYQSSASSAFQSKMDDWMTQYQSVMSAFTRLQEATGSAYKTYNEGEEHNRGLAGGFGGSGGEVYNVLGGN